MSVEFPDPSRVCILSGRFPPTEFRSAWNHRAYANRHGYTYVHCNWPTLATNRYMVKFHFIKEYIRHFDYLFWIDDDAFFINLNKPLDFLLPGSGKFASFCKSPTNKAIHTYLSSGQFLLRGGDQGLSFAEAVLDVPLEKVRAWWKDDLGMFTNGDQDAIVYLAHADQNIKGGICLFDYTAFNSRLSDLQKDPGSVFLLHFTGSREKKLADHRSAATLLKYGPSLLSPDVENRFFDIERFQPRSVLRRLGSRVLRMTRKLVKKFGAPLGP